MEVVLRIRIAKIIVGEREYCWYYETVLGAGYCTPLLWSLVVDKILKLLTNKRNSVSRVAIMARGKFENSLRYGSK